MLLKIEPRIDGQAQAIATLCGYLPQALRLAATALANRRDLQPADYARRLADEKNRLKVLDAGRQPGDESIDASISLSYGLLEAEEQKHWRMLGIFPEAFDSLAAAAVWDTKSDPAGDTLGKLLQYSMLEWNDAAKRYRLHDLMRDFSRQKLGKDEQKEVARRHALHYLDVLRAANELYKDGGESLMQGLALFDLERGNIEAGQAWAASHAESDPEAAQACSSYPSAGAYCLSLRQHPRKRIAWLDAALAGARHLKNRAAEGAHLGNLGIAYDDLGDTRRAIEYYEQELAITREIADRQGEGTALGNLGSAYASLGETRRAIEYYEQALKINQQIGDRRSEGAVLGNLGSAYASLGETRRAIEYHEQSLLIDRELGDRLGEGNALGNLGNAYSILGERRAIEYYEQALKINREIGDRRGEGKVLGNLGLVYAALGETRTAIEYYEQQLAITREIGDRRGEGNALWNMSRAEDDLGERNKATEHAQAALKIYEEIEDPKAEKVRKKLEEWRKQ